MSILEKFGNKLEGLNFEEPLSNMHKEIQNITSKLDSQKGKTFLGSVMDSNELSIDMEMAGLHEHCFIGICPKRVIGLQSIYQYQE